MFKLDTYPYHLRNSDDFFIPRFNTTTLCKLSLKYLGPVIWLKLDKNIKESELTNVFKKKIRKESLQYANMENNSCKNCHFCCC